MSTHFTSPFGGHFNGGSANPFGPRDGAAGGGAIHRIEEDEVDTLTSPTSPNFAGHGATPIFRPSFNGPFGGGDAPSDGVSGLRNPPDPQHYPAEYNFARRTSVSAESLKPSGQDSYDHTWTPPHHDKTPVRFDLYLFLV